MLPDCDKAVPAGIALDETEKAELVSAVMNKGLSGVDDFVRAHSAKGMIGEKIKSLRKDLETQLAAVRMQREKEYSELRMRTEKAYAVRLERLEIDETDVKGSVSDTDAIISSDILNLLLEQSEKGKTAAKKPGFLKRAWNAIRSFFRMVGNALLRFWDWVRRKHVKKRDDKIVLPKIAISGGKTLNLELAVSQALGDAGFRKKMDARMGRMSQTDRLRVRLDEERYREAVKKLLQEDLDKARKRDERDRRILKRQVSEQLEQIKREKQRVRERLEDEKKEIEKKMEQERGNARKELDSKPVESVRNELADQFESAGYIKRDGTSLYVTSLLVDRFAEIVYAMEVEGLGSTKKKMISGIGGFGEYQRDNIRTIYETGRMDLLDSVINSRMNHPKYRALYDEDIIVNRELKGDYFHVVIMFDKSGSMDENNRIVAAKRAALALFKAVKQHNRKNVVDMVAFDSKVKVMDLVDVWNCRPEGFTNIGDALNVSYGLLERSKADKKLIYLITDGLPEAYTSADGNVYIGDTGKSMQNAISSAARLRSIKDLKLIMIMLEPKQKLYTDAAKEIAGAADGTVITTDPQDLAREMLVDYAASLEG